MRYDWDNNKKIQMCLTIPKKVISVSGNAAVVENPDGIGQEVKTIIDLKVGDFVLTQQNIVLEKIDKKEAEEILNLLKKTIKEEDIL